LANDDVGKALIEKELENQIEDEELLAENFTTLRARSMR
jgi:hypothetical protein